ncbi:LacI family transcriptional regulator [Parasalinivibrio latis]|uniref:LacI family DNA-binding transcriptional regulator n=1 Tax=Parasalinivibrio latis TaxID=2952610 RepID=UPI0030E432B8
MKKPTIVDVAEAADVAIGTVSRYLNGQKLRVSNVKKIEDAIASLDYSANPIARAMKTKKTLAIGFFVPVLEDFNSKILDVLAEKLGMKGYFLLTYTHGNSPEKVRDALMFAEARHLDGIVFSGIQSAKEHVEDLVAKNLPVVIFNDNITDLEVDKVLVEDYQATYDAIKLAISFGHKKIGFVCGDFSSVTAVSRYQGYVDALKDASIPLDAAIIHRKSWTEVNGYVATQQFLSLEEPPTVIFYSNYVLTIGALRCLKSLGKTSGEDVDLISFDDPDMFSIMTPGVTAIQQPNERIAANIAELILSRIEDNVNEPPRLIKLDCHLQLRGSLKPVKS